MLCVVLCYVVWSCNITCVNEWFCDFFVCVLLWFVLIAIDFESDPSVKFDPSIEKEKKEEPEEEGEEEGGEEEKKEGNHNIHFD